MASLRGEDFLPVCPELLGGLPVPRPRSRFSAGDGFGVLEGVASLRDEEGRDVTSEFLEGARRAVSLARRFGVRHCLLKSRSPSCGCKAYPNSPVGVTAALLMEQGFPVSEWGLEKRKGSSRKK